MSDQTGQVSAEFVPDREGTWRYDLAAGTATHDESGHTVPLVRNGDCGYGVVPEEWHHGVAGPPMTDAPADRCER